MRPHVRAFVATAAESFRLRSPVYEFGSFQVVGQEAAADLRPLFPGRKYIGCDLRHGPGVDRVEDLASLSLPDGCAETIVCVDTLEHVYQLQRAVDQMIRVLAPGGVLLVSVPMEFRIHDYPDDFWRLTPSCVARLLGPLAATIVGSQGVDDYPHTVYGIGVKCPVPAGFASGVNRFVSEFPAWLELQAGQVPWRKRWKRTLTGLVASRGDRRRARDYFTSRFAVRLPAKSVSHTVGEPALATFGIGSRLDVA